MNSKDSFKKRPMQASQNAVLPEPNILVSPVPQLLQSNFPPTEDEIQKIQEIILVAQQEERKLKIFAGKVPRYTSSAHDAIYRESQKLRKDVQNFILKHQRFLSPLITLPTELLALIFIYCLPNLETARGIRRPTWQDQSFYLSQVCQRWRSIALDTPQLWAALEPMELSTSLQIFGSRNKNGHRKISLRSKDPNAYVEFLQEILNRSKDVGLQLWLHGPPSFAFEMLQDSLVNLLAKEAHRITTLTIESSPTTVNEFCATAEAMRSQPHSITFPRLRRLVLSLERYPEGSIIDGFAHTPALIDVTVNGVLPGRLSLPWAQLHTYSENAGVSRGYKGNLDLVLSSARHLQNLDVAWLGYDISHRSVDMMGISQEPSISLKVTNVRLDFPQNNFHEQSIQALLTRFYYPTVQSLRIESSFCDILGIFLNIIDTHYSRLSILPFINLTNFYYHSSASNASHFISFLRLCPNLEKLDIELPFPADLSTIISTYHSSNSGPNDNLNPALKRIVIHFDFLRLSYLDGERSLSLLGEATQILLNNLDKSPFPLIQLIFVDHGALIYSRAQVYLNRWSKTSHQFDNLIILSKWCISLYEEIPPLGSPRIAQRESRLKTFQFSPTRLNAILCDIERYNLDPYELRKLYISGLHVALHRLASLPDGLLPGDAQRKFRARARKIIERWAPLCRADLCSAKTLTLWVVKGTRSLVFIPPNDPRRTSPDAMKLIYGLDDDLELVEANMD